MKKLITILTFIHISNYAIADTITISRRIDNLEHNVKEIDANQLNYKIEKDLLKEAYTSNYSTIQIIISLIIGISAIFGFLGVKGILSLKNEYHTELAILKDLKIQFEVELKKLTSFQEVFKEQIISIGSLNEEQDKKIKILQIKEKAGSFYTQKNYQRVLEYVAIGLDISKDDIELLKFRASSFLKLRNFPEALEAHNVALKIEPTNNMLIQNIAELYLIEGKIEKYNDIIKEKGDYIKSDSNSILTYLEIFKFFKENKTLAMKKNISEFIKKNDLEINKNYTENWDFSELYESIKLIENTKNKTMLINFTNYLKGIMTGNQILKILKDFPEKSDI